MVLANESASANMFVSAPERLVFGRAFPLFPY
ncbi:MAG: hypothetical protein AB199_02345 [Parcubacteria bacterium C7867-004]|nr:MAG: hypothetical protein AB199_02345 [Parcubacteria bacterium C7867-004]